MRKATPISQASLLRKSILQAAVQGKLVPQDESDEPASVLLARIKAEKAQLIKEGKLKKEKALPPVSEEEKPFDLPVGWEWVRLKELLHFTDAGKSPSCEKRAATSNEWGVIRTTAVQENYFLEQENKVLPQGFIVDKRMQVQVGDILITRAGPKNRTGIACFVEQCTYKLILSDKTVRLNCNAKHLYKPFLVCALNSSPIRNLLSEKMTGMAESQVNLAQPSITSILFPLPPLAEQERIVAKVNELMHQCDQLEQAEQAALALDAHFFDTLPKSILQAAVQGKLVPQDEGDEPASVLLERIKAEKAKLIKEGKLKKEKPLPPITEEEKPFDLPVGWEWVRLGDIVSKIGAGSTPTGGRNVYKCTGYKFIRSQNVHNDALLLNGVAYIDDETHKKMLGATVQGGDILLNITGASIGRCCIVPDIFDTAHVNQHVMIIRLIDNKLKEYLHKLIVSPYFQGLIMDSQVGVSREGISGVKLKNFCVPLPPFNEQRRIVYRVGVLNFSDANGIIF